MDPEVENSDSSDEDYVPDKANEVLSEEESDDKISDPENDEDNPKRKKKTKKGSKSRKKQKVDETEVEEELKEEKKQAVDDIWADFVKDTGFKSKSEKSESVALKKPEPKLQKEEKKEEKVKVTQTFHFAGEEVVVEKEVPVSKTSSIPKTSTGKKTSGLGSFLSQLGKKNKISTLEKTKLDWDKFKKEENIEEELQTYNKGKDGYLERQDFLNRADLRRFEIEKNARTVERSKRDLN